ncbi:MAG: hypothetical protein E7359_04270 [Clostridiales bacterium]|nr:hypothetical protein [Clostridiales bacterium]
MLNLLLASTLPNWVTTLLPILRSVFVVLMLLASLIVIIICLATESNAESGSNVITGNSYESFYSQNKSSTREGRLKKLLIISSILTGVCSILYFVTLLIYPVI